MPNCREHKKRLGGPWWRGREEAEPKEVGARHMLVRFSKGLQEDSSVVSATRPNLACLIPIQGPLVSQQLRVALHASDPSMTRSDIHELHPSKASRSCSNATLVAMATSGHETMCQIHF